MSVERLKWANLMRYFAAYLDWLDCLVALCNTGIHKLLVYLRAMHYIFVFTVLGVQIAAVDSLSLEAANSELL